MVFTVLIQALGYPDHIPRPFHWRPGNQAKQECMMFITHEKLHHHALSGYAVLHASINMHCYCIFSDEDWAKEKQKLYDAIGYQEDGPGTVYPKEVHITPFSGSFCKDSPPCIACV